MAGASEAKALDFIPRIGPHGEQLMLNILTPTALRRQSDPMTAVRLSGLCIPHGDPTVGSPWDEQLLPIYLREQYDGLHTVVA